MSEVSVLLSAEEAKLIWRMADFWEEEEYNHDKLMVKTIKDKMMAIYKTKGE